MYCNIIVGFFWKHQRLLPFCIYDFNVSDSGILYNLMVYSAYEVGPRSLVEIMNCILGFGGEERLWLRVTFKERELLLNF